jgi:hypothetical protein
MIGANDMRSKPFHYGDFDSVGKAHCRFRKVSDVG